MEYVGRAEITIGLELYTETDETATYADVENAFADAVENYEMDISIPEFVKATINGTDYEIVFTYDYIDGEVTDFDTIDEDD